MIKYTKEKLEEVVKQSDAYHQVLQFFERNISGSAYSILKKVIIDFNLDTSHFLNASQRIELLRFENRIKRKISSENLFIEKSKASRGSVKNRILNEKIIKYECVECGSNGEWRDKKFALILDHINGINNDNRIVNLRFLCPNCNATLETHCKGFNGLKKSNLELITKKRSKKRVYIPRLSTRKVLRPSIDILKKEINNMGYSAVGRKYGVSDNAIRKWIK